MVMMAIGINYYGIIDIQRAQWQEYCISYVRVREVIDGPVHLHRVLNKASLDAPIFEPNAFLVLKALSQQIFLTRAGKFERHLRHFRIIFRNFSLPHTRLLYLKEMLNVECLFRQFKGLHHSWKSFFRDSCESWSCRYLFKMTSHSQEM